MSINTFLNKNIRNNYIIKEIRKYKCPSKTYDKKNEKIKVNNPLKENES